VNKLEKGIEKVYQAVLRDYLEMKREVSLRQAYEIGRQAVLEDVGLLRIVTVHHQLLAGLNDGRKTAEILSAGDFLRETLSSFEMIHRGYKEMVGALKQRTNELDETNRKLSELNETLETKVAEKSAAAEKKSQELVRVNHELEQFVHAAAHDLKEPLRTITSYVQLLQRSYQSVKDDEAQEYVHYVVEGTHRLQELIDDLLSYTRLNDRSQPHQLVEMPKVFREALSSLETVIKETGAQVTADGLPSVTANRAHMSLLLQNLISNALKFHGKDPPKIHVSARRDAGQWVFSVSDNGIGIDRKYFDKLFVVFQRLNTRDEYPGTGMGLALCRKIIEQLNGKIWLESEVGKGTVFYFAIPF